MSETTEQNEYQFNQYITDVHGNGYYVVAKTEEANTLLVTAIAQRHGGMNYCIPHRIAYKNHEACEICRLQVVANPTE